jgi:uncharacterized protein YaeQ
MHEKYTFDLKSPKVKQKLILVKSDLELHAHVVMKLLGFLLFYDPGLKIEAGVEMHYKPDLVIPGDHGVPRLWIDCGKIAIRKVESLAQKLRTTRTILIKETRHELDQFRKVVEKKVDHFERIEYLAFEPNFISGIAGAMSKVNDFTLYEVMENVIGVAINEEVFESTLYR